MEKKEGRGGGGGGGWGEGELKRREGEKGMRPVKRARRGWWEYEKKVKNISRYSRIEYF